MKKRDKLHARKDPRYKVLKHVVQKKLRCAYYQYVENIIKPFNNDNHLETNKRFWGLLKHAKADNTGVHPLKNNGTLVSEPQEKASLLNFYFQSVFTRESPLTLKQHCLNSMQENSYHYPTMPETTITREGIVKLLKNLKNNQGRWSR